MGNRHTITTLTSRELDTVFRSIIKLRTILRRRSSKPNEAYVPYNTLHDAVDMLELLVEQVEQVRSEQNA